MIQQVFRLSFSLAFSLVAATKAAPQDRAAEPPDKIPVIFPALEYEVLKLPCGVGEFGMPVDLVVLGTARKMGEGASRSRYEIAIEKVLAGSSSRKTIRVAGYLTEDERQIFGLARSIDRSGADDYIDGYELPPTEEKAQVAFGKARLDYYALSSPWIFVGEEIQTRDGGQNVRVTRVLRGEGLKPGQEVVVDGFGSSETDALPRAEPMLYCCSDKNRHDHRYSVAIRLPEEMEGPVRAAMARRDSYPVVVGEDGGTTHKVRPILFTGSTDEAIKLLASVHDATAMFIRQSLIHQGPGVRARLDQEIRQRLLPPHPGEAARRIQWNLCRILSVIDREGLAKILDERIASLETAGPTVDTTNPSMSYLLTHLADGLWLARHHGQRLLALPDKLGPKQKELVQSALAEVQLADRVELAAALQRTGSLPVVRTQRPAKPPVLRAMIQFTADPSLLRTFTQDGILHTRDAATLAIKSATTLPASHAFISAQPSGGKLALIAKVTQRDGSGWPDEFGTMRVIEFDTGKRVAEIPLAAHWRYTNTHEVWLPNQELLVLDDRQWHRVRFATAGTPSVETLKLDISKESELFNGMGELTEDGRSLLILDGGGKSSTLKVKSCDLATRAMRTLGKIDLPSGCWCNERGLVPGGRNFFFGDPGFYLYDRTTLKPALAPLFPKDALLAIAFAADGSKVAVASGKRGFEDGQWIPDCGAMETMIRVQDLATGKTLLAFPSPTRWVRALALSPDGMRLVLLREDSVIESYQLPAR